MGRFGEERRSECRHLLLLLNSHGGIAFGSDHKPPRLALRAPVSKRPHRSQSRVNTRARRRRISSSLTRICGVNRDGHKIITRCPTSSPHYARITCCDRGYGRPSARPRVFLRQAQDKLTLRRTEQVRLRSEPLWLPGGTTISTISRRRLVHNAG